MFTGLSRFKKLQHLWIKTEQFQFIFAEFNETIPVKHLHIYTRWILAYNTILPRNGTVFTKLETLDIVYFTRHEMKLFEILTEQKSSLRAMSVSQYSSIASVLDLAEDSAGHSETVNI